MDAVFKLLHVEVARKATYGYEREKKKKKKNHFLRFYSVKLKKSEENKFL